MTASEAIEPKPANSSESRVQPSSKKSRRRQRRFISLAIFALVVAMLWIFRGPLLRGAANAWVVNEPVQKADLIVVLGGGVETRPFAAARLYREGAAARILVMNPKASPSQEMKLTREDADLVREILVRENVPDGDIVTCAETVDSTFSESVAVRNWALTNGVKRVIIPTDVFHTRRVAWLFRQQLASAGISVTVQAVPVRQYSLDDWWQKENGVVAFQNEIIKYAFYRLKY